MSINFRKLQIQHVWLHKIQRSWWLMQGHHGKDCLEKEPKEGVKIGSMLTLSLQVQFVVKMTIDLFGLTVTSEKSSKNSHAFHPQFFLRHTGILGTLAFTVASVTAFPAGFGVLTNPGTGVDGNGLFDDLKLWNGKKMSKNERMFHLATKMFTIENSDEMKYSIECQFSVK